MQVPEPLGVPSAVGAEGGEGCDKVSEASSVITPTEPESTPHESPVQKETTVAQEERQAKQAKHDAQQEKPPAQTESKFKRTMSVATIFDKVVEFGGPTTLPTVSSIVGTNQSNQRKGARHEVALTRRERNQERKNQDGQEGVAKPKDWDNKDTIAANQQTTPKRRGRKPKTKVDNKTEATPSAGTAVKKTQAKAKAKAKAQAKKKAEAKSKARAKSKAKTKKEDQKAKTRGDKPPNGDGGGGGDDDGDDHADADADAAAEKKKAMSRKSSVYHKAMREAEKEGLSKEKCKELAKKVLNYQIISFYLLLYVFLFLLAFMLHKSCVRRN